MEYTVIKTENQYNEYTEILDDMVKIIGNRSKVSEVLNRKIPLSLNMIRRACEEFSIPATLLIEKYKLAV